MRLELYLPYQYPDQEEALNFLRQAEHIAGLEVALKTIGAGDTRPLFAGAMPIYLLDGRLLAAGHPPPEALLATLRRLAAGKPSPRLLQDVLGNASQEKLAALSPHLRVKDYSKGQRIFVQGEAANALYLLRRGRVELYRLTRSAKRLKLAAIRPGMIFGEACVLGGVPRNATAEVAEAAQVVTMDRADIERFIEADPDFTLYLVKELSRRLQESNWRLVTLAYADVSTRLAAELLHVSQEERATLLPITHQDLAERSGLLRETVTKTLDTFQEEGLVELHRGQVRLRDVQGLRSMLEHLHTEGILQG
jgi:CRP/FNR family cyclic AMP-dependent transcriptional regulator